MKMPTLTIDGRQVAVDAGATVLEAARKLGLQIPTLCSVEGCRAETSCMVCVVRINGKQKLEPSCATRAVDGMAVESETDEVRVARRTALDLLLGEHVGDCEAPCRRACPAHMNIPLMIRQIAAGKLRESLATVKQHIALPAIVGRLCPAPCEKACRRASYDSAVSICLLKRFVADDDLGAPGPWSPACKAATGKKVAIVGAGPAGLATAYYLLQDGHACTIFDGREAPGGMLRYSVPDAVLPKEVLDAEIDGVRRLGAEFRLGTAVGRDVSMADLETAFDAVVLATGAADAARATDFGVTRTERGIHADTSSHLTSRARVFAGGDAVFPVRQAIHAVAHGKAMAVAIHQLLSGEPVTGPKHRFNSRIGKLKDGEMEEFLKEAERTPRQEPPVPGQGLSGAGAVAEARRCLHCDCRKRDDCRLRDWAQACGASQQRYAGPERAHVRKIVQHAGVIYEPGKCIKCGLCVQVTGEAGERLGLTFLGRGFDAQIGVPFNESLAAALEKTARRCVEVCPTGALTAREA